MIGRVHEAGSGRGDREYAKKTEVTIFYNQILSVMSYHFAVFYLFKSRSPGLAYAKWKGISQGNK